MTKTARAWVGGVLRRAGDAVAPAAPPAAAGAEATDAAAQPLGVIMPDDGEKGDLIRLNSIEDGENFAISDWIQRREAQDRSQLLQTTNKLFVHGNVGLWIAVAVLTAVDCVHLWRFDGSAADRIINSDVLYALIGATVVQVGAIMLGVSRHFFPGPSK